MKKINYLNLLLSNAKLKGEDDNDDKVDIEALIAQKVEEATSALKNNTNKILQEKREIEEQLKSVKKSQKESEDKKLEESGDFKKILENTKNEMSITISSKEQEILELRKQLSERDSREKKSRIADKIRSEFLKREEFEVSAVDDAVHFALSEFNDIDEAGNPVFKDENGFLKANKFGKNYSAADYIDSLAEKRKYMLKQKIGSDLKNNFNGTDKIKISKEEYRATIAKGGKEADDLIEKTKKGLVIKV